LADLLVPLLGALLGGAVGGIGSAAQGNAWNGSYENINTGAEDTAGYKNLMDASGNYSDLMNQMLTSMTGALGKAESTAQNYDTRGFWKDFMKSIPDIQSMTTDSTSWLRSALESNLSNFTKQAVAESSSDLSGMGNLYSGALGSIIGTKAGEKAGESNTQLASMMSSLFGNLAQSSMSNASAQSQTKLSSILQSLLTGANQYGSLAGTYGSLSAQTLGQAAEMTTPVYEYQQGIWDSIMQGMVLGTNFGSSFDLSKIFGSGGSGSSSGWMKSDKYGAGNR
jgi:hypothetical protein